MMTPLRWFQAVYFFAFGVSMVVAVVAPEQIRLPMVVLGVLLATFGGCLVSNLFGFATETASKAGKSRWTAPAFASVPLVRAMGVFFVLGGLGFAAQALFVRDL